MKYVLMRDIAKAVANEDIQQVISVAEAWTAKASDTKTGFAEDAPNRGEALMIAGAERAGRVVSLSIPFYRDARDQRRVTGFGKEMFDPESEFWALAPFLEVWGQPLPGSWTKYRKMPPLLTTTNGS